MDDLAKKFAELADQYGPNVVDAARGAAITEAWSSLVMAIIVLVFGIGLILLSLWVCRRKWDDLQYLFGGMGIVIGTIMMVAGIAQILDPWLWTTLKYPDLWIAKKILGL